MQEGPTTVKVLRLVLFCHIPGMERKSARVQEREARMGQITQNLEVITKVLAFPLHELGSQNRVTNFDFRFRSISPTLVLGIDWRKAFSSGCTFLMKDKKSQVEKITLISKFSIEAFIIVPGSICTLLFHNTFLSGPRKSQSFSHSNHTW